MHLFTLTLTISEILTFQMLTLKFFFKFTEYNIGSDAIRLQISTSIQVIACICTLAFIIPKILKFKNVDFENLSISQSINMCNDAGIAQVNVKSQSVILR